MQYKYVGDTDTRVRLVPHAEKVAIKPGDIVETDISLDKQYFKQVTDGTPANDKATKKKTK